LAIVREEVSIRGIELRDEHPWNMPSPTIIEERSNAGMDFRLLQPKNIKVVSVAEDISKSGTVSKEKQL
jgi:hypothetical protein